ncbi:hypothetical protein GUITHDRAFT_135056 [Guillardia theta CCMP2712]|uniref:Uncharacterized protein n=1 Tax=Guillardia theta (strain CCMP2712) TaxID=905079 RepID=L1JR04_GUITC|nr:hypothetical protein GUITHDRAFT_135056 [Guillardia theta CCMP2712]EKX50996.1 hypothetical protein GUITHDRAFT_135056 [Guillardia theta CCMP2712]|eukprot:XP_005837976.1 hypothetical protein GUITHDRAFT_135056 [Guillardia theta CCMP2712]
MLILCYLEDSSVLFDPKIQHYFDVSLDQAILPFLKQIHAVGAEDSSVALIRCDRREAVVSERELSYRTARLTADDVVFIQRNQSCGTEMEVIFQNKFFIGNLVDHKRQFLEQPPVITNILPDFKVSVSQKAWQYSTSSKGSLLFIGTFRPNKPYLWVDGEAMQTCRSRPNCEHAGQGFHLTAYSFAEKLLKALYQSSDLKGICRFLCRIGALLPNMNAYQASSQADKRCRYSKQAMINQLMNVSVMRGFDGVVEELANIALMFYQRIPYISVDLKGLLDADVGQAEENNTTKSAEKSSDFIDFHALVIFAFQEQVHLEHLLTLSSSEEQPSLQKLLTLLARHLFLCPRGLTNAHKGGYNEEELSDKEITEIISKSFESPRSPSKEQDTSGENPTKKTLLGLSRERADDLKKGRVLLETTIRNKIIQMRDECTRFQENVHHLFDLAL